ncbi:hypothetical protein E2C01_009551 [Portunus trituberculatus]|uniref:Uncharacterized protein n=1 Tax=Portunus trituberculatus TaxID=210409 RepID=A0A5B7D636_PORTR|nr:hypothetical protein [Portunus trituberculatus]
MKNRAASFNAVKVRVTSHLPGGATVLPSAQRYSAPTYENRIRVINVHDKAFQLECEQISLIKNEASDGECLNIKSPPLGPHRRACNARPAKVNYVILQLINSLARRHPGREGVLRAAPFVCIPVSAAPRELRQPCIIHSAAHIRRQSE